MAGNAVIISFSRCLPTVCLCKEILRRKQWWSCGHTTECKGKHNYKCVKILSQELQNHRKWKCKHLFWSCYLLGLVTSVTIHIKVLKRGAADSPQVQEAVLSVWPKLHDCRHSDTKMLFDYLVAFVVKNINPYWKKKKCTKPNGCRLQLYLLLSSALVNLYYKIANRPSNLRKYTKHLSTSGRGTESPVGLSPSLDRNFLFSISV